MYKSLCNIVCLFVILCFFTLAGISCFATSTYQAAPPMTVKQGEAPKAAFLPIVNKYDQDVADLVREKLTSCLQERNYYNFLPYDEVKKVVDETGFDMTKIFGLSDNELKVLGEKLGVDYMFEGLVVVKKSLKFSGWRKDVDANVKLHDGNGKKIDSWRSMTEFSFGETETVMDAEKMGDAVSNHLCAKIIGK